MKTRVVQFFTGHKENTMGSYQLLEEPLTIEECRKAENQYVTGVVRIPLNSVIEHNLEEFLDILEYSLIGDIGIVSDIEYDIVGNGLNDEIHIRVSGFVDLIRVSGFVDLLGE